MKNFEKLLRVAAIAAAVGAIVCFVVVFRNEIAGFFTAVKDKLSEGKSCLCRKAEDFEDFEDM